MTHNEEKNQSIEMGLKITQIIQLVDKDIKTAMIYPIFKNVGENSTMFSRDLENNGGRSKPNFKR